MRLNIDYKSIKLRLWIYFVLFAALLMGLLWFLQIFFLSVYYQEMKINETLRIANSIVDKYGQEGLFDEIARVMRRNDMYIQIEAHIDDAYLTLYSPYYNESAGDGEAEAEGEDKSESESESEAAPVPFPVYSNEIRAIREQLMGHDSHEATGLMDNPMRDARMLAYCTYLDRTEGQEVLLYIFSPLYPVESTIEILANQLRYITVISLILACLLSFYISHIVTKPLTQITKSAVRLAEGQYGVVFEGGRYSETVKLADTLNDTSQALARTDNLQKDLLANVSHDLRTPLTMVKSYAEMIRDLSGDDPVKRNEHLGVIIDEADRLSLLVSDLLELSQMQSGRQALSFTSFSLRETIESLLSSYRIYAEQDGFSLLFHADGDGLITGDEGKLKQVLSNLITNAIKFSGEARLVEIELSQRDGAVRCAVRDHGVGIQKKDLKNIWQRYYKSGGNYLRAAEGTGLGLSIVKEILALHHAKFGVDSEPGKGSSFWFELNA
ncbi:MAG: HAMP domain-containing histidine kinase [Clostridiales Family XIII bacterium]|nr:HAMP domain-containing histidine kinase [Clostridiales Family XIII bacterium]